MRNYAISRFPPPWLPCAGLLCFAGGAGEAVWAWDLRGGQARALYELSTGNAHVHSLAWHEASNR